MSVGEFLTVGMVVEARWTNSHSYYAEPAEVVRVNRSSVRVRVLDGYLKGREIPLRLNERKMQALRARWEAL